jgi:prophage regulatory protein
MLPDDELIPAVIGPVLITAGQLAHKLQVSTRTLWRKLSEGVLPKPVRLGGIVRWRSEEIEIWIAGGCPKPQAREN